MRPHKGKNNIITVHIVAVVFVVIIIIIITVGNKTPKRSTYVRPSPVQFSAKRWLCNFVFGAHNARCCKLPRGP